MEIYSFCPLGYHGTLVKIEVELRRGIPGIDIVGLPDSAVKESRERVRAALRHGGFAVPKHRILINLSPAGIRKAGAGYDLALAIAILVSSGQLPWELDEPLLVVGELSLSGAVRSVRGLPAAIDLAAEQGITRCIIPAEQPEIFRSNRFWMLTLDHLKGLNTQVLRFMSTPGHPEQKPSGAIPEHIMRLEPLQRLAYGVSLAGGHHALLLGPPGTGKTTFLRMAWDYRPGMLEHHSRESQRIGATAFSENPPDQPGNPVRWPSASSSYEGIFGGGRWIQPGEVSMSHGGILVMDELMDFGPKILGGLRIPMEQDTIQVSRADSLTRYPCEFTLWAAANLCPCGARGRETDICLCDSRSIQRYWSTLGAALYDRFDMRILFPGYHTEDIEVPSWLENPQSMETAVQRARDHQQRGIFTQGVACLHGRLAGTEFLTTSQGSRGYREYTAIERLSLTLAVMENRRHVLPEDIVLARILREPPGLDIWMGELVGVCQN